MSESETNWGPAALRQAAAHIVQAAGSSPEEAKAVADNLVMANLKGHDSHGVGMLPRYMDAVAEGGLTPNTGVTVKLDLGSLLTLDGQRGYGQVVGQQAMDMGIARAQTHGSCIMALGQAHHLGRIGHWAEMAIDAGLVAIHFVNVLAPPVVVLVCLCKDASRSYLILQPVASRRARCAWPTMKAVASQTAF
jgi:hydroxycarboxylate dehydrogenase B